MRRDVDKITLCVTEETTRTRRRVTKQVIQAFPHPPSLIRLRMRLGFYSRSLLDNRKEGGDRLFSFFTKKNAR